MAQMMNGQLLGIITLQPVRAIPKERREIETVEQAIAHCEPTETVGPAIQLWTDFTECPARKLKRSSSSRIVN
jgi:hypothetical protein